VNVRFRHVGLNVSDLDASVAFYCQHLGFTQGPAFLREDGTRSGVYLYLSHGVFLELFEKEPGALPGHLCFEVDDVHATVQELRKKGLDVSDVSLGRSKALMAFLKDPDGYPIELNEFSPPESWIARYLADEHSQETLLCHPPER
jgi:catechol 2,3-dioxygenase-like lactoylglutathione lyase family enzyme